MLSSLCLFQIRGEFQSEPDTGGLDSVVFGGTDGLPDESEQD